MEEQKNIPSLRFPEFNGEWEIKTLGELTDNFSTRNKGLVDAEVFSVTNSNGFVLQTEHFEDRVIAGSDLSNYKIVKKGDFAYNPARINVGSIAQFLNEVGIISSLYVCFRVKSNLSDKFLHYILLLDSTKNKINDFGEGGVRIYLWYDLFARIPILIPTLPEQTRITSFFNVLDKKIAELKQKKTLLERYKKGVMQKLFSQELRFKDDNGKEFPKWEKKKLGEVAIIRSGLSKDQNGDIEGYKVTRIETISDGSINIDKIGFINIDDKIDDYKLMKGDILFSNINSVSHIGKTAIAYSDLDLYHGMNLLCLKSLVNTIPFYLYYFLNTVKLRNYFKRICNQAVSQASINQTELAKTQISLPCLAEQIKIANFLSAIDEKINHTKTQIQKTEQYKKGLLQRMFV